MGTTTKENARTKAEIAVLLYSNKDIGFHLFMKLTEDILDKYYHTRKKEEREARTHM